MSEIKGIFARTAAFQLPVKTVCCPGAEVAIQLGTELMGEETGYVELIQEVFSTPSEIYIGALIKEASNLE